MNLQHLKGIGEKTLNILFKAGIYNTEDLLTYYPYRYQVLQPDTLENSLDNIAITINAIVMEEAKVSFIRKNFNSLRFKAESYGKIINVTIFNRSFLKPNLKVGKEITLIGKYNSAKNSFVASDIKLTKIENMKIVPIYHSIKGLKNNTLEKIITEALKENELVDNIPLNLIQKYHFISKKEAVQYIHQPEKIEEVSIAQKRLVYEELFIFMFKIQYLKSLKEAEIGIKKNIPIEKVETFIKNLPFSLTKDQKKGIQEGLTDLTSAKKMNRLLIGDVGSGKTIVATVLMFANFLAGLQSAFLAPTEILAIQHFYSIRNFFQNTNIQVDLLIGSMSKKEKETILMKVHNHEIDILIGTHAILNEKLIFHKLGFVVTDEQHRFGVAQREFLGTKGIAPDMLFMSATPIPRTYALTIYGDMDMTEIKEKPNGRKDIITKIVKEQDLKEVLFKILEEIKQNHQVYVVAPAIEENEETNLKDVNLLKDKFNLAFQNKVPIGVLHGKLKKSEKEEVMNDFKIGKTKILISTTVIEVGVDVKDATVMVIFDADRFGLATLHQLRGRVGRNDFQCYCYLICNEEKERLKVLEDSNDGFYISEKDFEFRGEGDLFGQKQSGDMTFKIANIKRDFNILTQIKKDVEDFIKQEEYKTIPKYKQIIEEIDFTN